ncbi:hypothetical protein [Trichlorobacter ammonificans]|uniref:Lipopolysaccharide assembly protein A domain-containing protein n=1 Tax=Trichlorobacter ammonificans TaxID=2916410 RepID=A0ABM9D8X6_9BACT|nr:hypothetical protein [Trichlorobacter ammonificans]CAH2031008.1 conserved protein of unknown function [Trichlorobacter ammonificans]
MEVAGGLMIMGGLLGVLCMAVWLSLPILLISLRNRLAESRVILEELSQRIAALEKRLHCLPPPSPSSVSSEQTVPKSDQEG